MLTIFLCAVCFAAGFYHNRLLEAVRAAKWFTDLKG